MTSRTKEIRDLLFKMLSVFSDPWFPNEPDPPNAFDVIKKRLDDLEKRVDSALLAQAHRLDKMAIDVTSATARQEFWDRRFDDIVASAKKTNKPRKPRSKK